MQYSTKKYIKHGNSSRNVNYHISNLKQILQQNIKYTGTMNNNKISTVYS